MQEILLLTSFLAQKELMERDNGQRVWLIALRALLVIIVSKVLMIPFSIPALLAITVLKVQFYLLLVHKEPIEIKLEEFLYLHVCLAVLDISAKKELKILVQSVKLDHFVQVVLIPDNFYVLQEHTQEEKLD